LFIVIVLTLRTHKKKYSTSDCNQGLIDFPGETKKCTFNANCRNRNRYPYYSFVYSLPIYIYVCVFPIANLLH